jgi:hypothetical protein
MTSDDAAQIWWNGIAGPRRIIAHVLDLLTVPEANLRKHLVFTVSGCPWPDTMRERIRGFMEHEYGLYTSQIDAHSIGSEPLDRYLLENFADQRISIAFRESEGVSIAGYLQNNKILYRKLFWITGVNQQQLAEWLPFFRKYQPRNNEDGLFLLEYSDSLEKLAETAFPRCIVPVDMMQEASLYDRLSFAMNLIAEMEEIEQWKHCIARIAVYFYGNNIEMLADTLLHSGNKDIFLEKLVSVDSVRFKKVFWQAQLEIFFPLIERQRTRLIEKYYDQIEYALQQHDELYFGERITDPIEAELGLLIYLANKLDQNNNRFFYFPYADYSILADLHECRNKLAHRDCLDIIAINRLLEGCNYG